MTQRLVLWHVFLSFGKYVFNALQQKLAAIKIIVIFSVTAVTLQSTVNLQVTTPPEGPFCPGENVVLTCSIQSIQKSMTIPPTMYWQQAGTKKIRYYNGKPRLNKFGYFDSTADFSNNNYNIISNATLYNVLILHNGISVSCFTHSSPTKRVIIRVAGIYSYFCLLVILFILYNYEYHL